MPELFVIKAQDPNTNQYPVSEKASLHKDALEILFKYKETICNKFTDIRGLFLIDHFAINIIDPDQKIVIFSTTPSVEYNLISQGLWKHDRTFSASWQTANRFYSWEKAYEENQYFEKLKSIKEINHGFTCAFSLSKKVGSFQFIYSFATRHQKPDLLQYYREHADELLIIGDYGYKAVSEIYEHKYAKAITTPKSPPFLKLISNKPKEK